MPIPVEEQLQFLLSCVRHSDNGRPNFDAVAKELNIVTKAAAAKRYERMVKATNVARNPTNGPPAAPAGKATKAKAAASTGRKRKTPAVVNISDSDDEEEIKAEIKDEIKSEIKEEDADVKPPTPKRPKREAAPKDMKEKETDEDGASMRLCDIPMWPGGGDGCDDDDGRMAASEDDKRIMVKHEQMIKYEPF
ncbi:hypothetical protein OQA88_12215 [Cercophora sp. LCS_1]